MLRSLKLVGLGGLEKSGAFQLVRDSGWRKARLLILCYHGISLQDEHLWSPGMYLSAADFSERLEQVRSGGYQVLPLGEAIDRLYAHDLPPRAVVITFDDGLYDFYAQAFPLLNDFQFPATVYLTTYYSAYNRPVFRLVCDYMMWQMRGRLFEQGVVDGPIDLRTPESRASELVKLDLYAKQNNLSGAERDQLAADLAKRIGADWQAILDRRILHIMKDTEARRVADCGIDVELHTHRHLTPNDKDLFVRELDDNAKHLQAATGHRPRHFCYPSGVHYEAYPQWLREWGVQTAVTCKLGLANAANDVMLLPRFCDHSGISNIEFRGWLCGLLAGVPKRSYHAVDPD